MRGQDKWVQVLCLPLTAQMTLLLIRASAQDLFYIRAGMAQLARSWGVGQKGFCLLCKQISSFGASTMS